MIYIDVNSWQFPLVQWIGLQLCLGIPTIYSWQIPQLYHLSNWSRGYHIVGEGRLCPLGKYELFYWVICLSLRVAGVRVRPRKWHPVFHLAHHRLVLSSRSFRSSCTFTSCQTSPGSDLVTCEFAGLNSYPPAFWYLPLMHFETDPAFSPSAFAAAAIEGYHTQVSQLPWRLLPHWSAPGCTNGSAIREKMCPVLGRRHILQILNGIVSLVQIFVVYLAFTGCILRFKKCKRHKAMNPHILTKDIGVIVSRLILASSADMPISRHNPTTGTDLSARHLIPRIGINHCPPLFALDRVLLYVLESELVTFQGGALTAAFGDGTRTYTKLPCSNGDGGAPGPFYGPSCPPQNRPGLDLPGATSWTSCIGM